LLREARRLLRTDRGPFPSPIVPAPSPTREQLFPSGWVEEDCAKAESLLRLGRIWKQAVVRHGAASEAAERAREKFDESSDHFLTFLHRYFDLPRADPGSPFAREAARLSAALHGIDGALMLLSAASPFRGEPTVETWTAIERLDGAVAELDDAVAAYRSPAPRAEATPVPARPTWDPLERVLRLGASICKRFKRSDAENQFRLIAAFQGSGWPTTISNPFKLSDTLRDTIKHLNESMEKESPIAFGIREGKPEWHRR
jgi:hypothetical protein